MEPDQVRILVADCDKAFRELVQETLEKYFIQVSVAESGPQVLAMCERTYFHLVIVGNHLPGMLGIEVVRRLERNYPRMRRILTSEHDTDAVIDSALDYGMIDRYLQKPLEIKDLVWEVKFLLGSDSEPVQEELDEMAVEVDEEEDPLNSAPYEAQLLLAWTKH